MPETQSSGPWQISLKFSFSFGPMTGTATLEGTSIGKQISGSTKFCLEGSGKTLPPLPTDFEGSIQDNETKIDLWINEPLLKHTHFICCGQAVIRKERFEGNWDMPCLDPKDCACDGASGTFELRRLGQES
ncbi:hypothetical protein [Litorimonas haliclonae]|uniref:hypothetical protein n=1 Tax=Litorimonas haliclonae TaxID=2081977 RepID=UPI0039EEA8EA